jgi:hypothetical protein
MEMQRDQPSVCSSMMMLVEDDSYSLVPIEPGSILMTTLFLHHDSKLFSRGWVGNRIRPLSQMIDFVPTSFRGEKPSYYKTLMVFKKEKMLLMELYSLASTTICEQHQPIWATSPQPIWATSQYYLSTTILVPIVPEDILMTTLILVHGGEEFYAHGVNYVPDKIRSLWQIVTDTGDEPSYDKTLMVSMKEKTILMEVFGYNSIWIGQHHNQRIKALFPTGSTARKRFIVCTNQICKWREFLLPNDSTAALDLHLRSCPYASEDRSTTKAISAIEQEVSNSLLVPIEPGSILMTALILLHSPDERYSLRGADRIRPLSQMVTAGGDEPSYDKTLMVFKKEKMHLAELYCYFKFDVSEHHAERNVCIKEEVLLVEDDSNSLVPIEPGGFLMTALILHQRVNKEGGYNKVFHQYQVRDRIRPLSQMVTATGDEPSYDKTLMVFKKEKMFLMEIYSDFRYHVCEYHAERLTDTVCNKEEMLLVEDDDSTTLVPIEPEDILMTTLMRARSNPEEFHGVNYVVNKIRPLSQMVTATGDEPSYDKTTVMVFKEEKTLLAEIFFYNINWIDQLHYQRIKETFLTDWIERKRFISCTHERCGFRDFLTPIDGPAALDRHLCLYRKIVKAGDFKRADLKQDDEESD